MKQIKKGEELMSPIIFKKIKNTMFSNYNIYNGDFYLIYIDPLIEYFWEEIGEKNPVKNINISTNNNENALLALERLEEEPSPKRFIEIFQAIHKRMIDNDESEITYKKYGYMGENAPAKFLHILTKAFDKFDVFHLLKIEELTKQRSEFLKYDRITFSAKIDIEYIGNDFGVEESEEISLNGFESKKIEELKILNKNNINTKKEKWWNKFDWEFGFKNLLPYFKAKKRKNKLD